MEQIMEGFELTGVKNRIVVLKLEIDYELMTLHDALLTDDDASRLQTLEKLKKLQQELKKLEIT
ncbi:hypothetical protein AJ85_09190 [Alkalihalobacillus alcalophilus ATCC 27647 = CGMCC 1.3604]|uniref:Uncharacterized protein n=1 Tax=Alkalihalobacillus alcalophilus ATCC 27647 = CGMCC 1.3604 TaxID=1218173 RepID=A0A094XJC3_ALKAL|nr:hypothetical protein [Alkalihalobacillus alcalophilus]KGA98850.1 hypothetical protein BALCAV_0201880 [Alkalihalobacillus alcalophilus ATCC 27647 = CGMCC 1.3604]MED1564259.1 hypothetical protein [Alkalihalobacillus alcalophilus]THG90735.1 hypothetical protein AJ85_09190 [Alkalihalobacillus alcalophilus ATCC 27647 = CGMCC 1.3604]